MAYRRTTISAVFDSLAKAPNGVDCTVDEVLIACGQFVAAILEASCRDQTIRGTKADWFINGLRASIERCNTRQLRREEHSTEMVLN